MTRKLWLLCGRLAVAGVVTSQGGVASTTTAAQERAQEQRPPTLPMVPVLPQPTVRVEEPPLRPAARMKPLEPGKKIVDHFDAGAGDRDVVVERWIVDGGVVGPPPGTSWTAWKTMYSPVVFVVRVNDIKGYVTEDGSWIESLITGTVTRVLKDATQADMRVDAPVSCVTSDGRLEIDGSVLQTVTRTGQHRTREFRVNGEYLVFATVRSGGAFFAPPSSTFEIVGNRLHVLRDNGWAELIAAADADEVCDEVISSAGLQAPRRRLGGQG